MRFPEENQKENAPQSHQFLHLGDYLGVNKGPRREVVVLVGQVQGVKPLVEGVVQAEGDIRVSPDGRGELTCSSYVEHCTSSSHVGNSLEPESYGNTCRLSPDEDRHPWRSSCRRTWRATT